MSEPINICPVCHAPFTKGSVNIKKAEDIKIHYWWHKLEYGTIPPMIVKQDAAKG